MQDKDVLWGLHVNSLRPSDAYMHLPQCVNNGSDVIGNFEWHRLISHVVDFEGNFVINLCSFLVSTVAADGLAQDICRHIAQIAPMNFKSAIPHKP